MNSIINKSPYLYSVNITDWTSTLGLGYHGLNRVNFKTLPPRSSMSFFKPGVFNLLSSRANLHLSYNPAGRSHCRFNNHHGYLKHHHMGMGGSLGDVGEVPMAPPHSPTLTSLHLRHSSFSNPSAASPTSHVILQPFRCFTYVTGTSRTLPGEPPMHRGMKNSV